MYEKNARGTHLDLTRASNKLNPRRRRRSREIEKCLYMQSDRGRKRNENFLRPRQLEKQQKQAAGPKTLLEEKNRPSVRSVRMGGQANAAAEATGREIHLLQLLASMAVGDDAMPSKNQEKRMKPRLVCFSSRRFNSIQ